MKIFFQPIQKSSLNSNFVEHGNNQKILQITFTSIHARVLSYVISMKMYNQGKKLHIYSTWKHFYFSFPF